MTGTVLEDRRVFMIIWHWVLLRARNVQAVSEKNVVAIIHTHVLCSITFSQQYEHHMTYDEKYGTAIRNRGDNRMRIMHCARWMTQATDKYSEYVANAYCFCTAKILTRTLFIIACIPKLFVLLWSATAMVLERCKHTHTFTMLIIIIIIVLEFSRKSKTFLRVIFAAISQMVTTWKTGLRRRSNKPYYLTVALPSVTVRKCCCLS